MKNISIASSRPTTTKSNCPESLETAKFVFMLNSSNEIGGKLNKRFDEPYKVVKRNKFILTININGKHENIALDRLKPAKLERRVSIQV